jgi:hypothetical protein
MNVLRIPKLVVIGGGTIGAGSALQLLRARAAGRLETEEIVVVDRDPACAARALPAPVTVVTGEWSHWLAANMDALAESDHVVPDHWAPHLLREWLVSELTRRGASVSRAEGLRRRGLPFVAPTRDGDLALSYAAWVCPPRCIEPDLCPHTRGPKSWSLADDLARDAPGEAWDAHIVFRCLHLVYGIGTVPVADILAARELVLTGLGRGTRRYLIATSSHCHGLASAITVQPAGRIED